MHRMRCFKGVVDHEANCGVGAGVVDVPFWVLEVGGVSCLGEEEKRGIVVGPERRFINGPQEVACFVYFGVDVKRYSCSGVGGWGDRVEGGCFCECILFSRSASDFLVSE